MKLNNGIEIVSMDQRIGRVRLLSAFAADGIRASEDLQKRLGDIGQASQWGLPVKNTGSIKGDNFNFSKVGDILPRSEDYISVRFRALSKTIVPGHWIDWSKDDVLKNSVAKLLGATVYPNHDFTDINNWLGSVSNAVWDEDGSQSGGVPGINAEYKIDALMNPRIARGLLMQPPAIHSTSMTVLFKFEFSHPDIATESRGRFYELLGEEVDGQIVRFIVTEILEYWEASLVFQGADRLARKHDEHEDDFADMSANNAAADNPPANSIQERTMKLSQEQKTKLGIEFDGEDVPETEIFKAAESFADRLAQFSGVDPVNIADLQAKAKAGEAFIEKQRAEVTRLARLAELGADEGDLDEVVSQAIADADFDRLVKLEGYFQKRVSARFPTNSRSSQEDASAIETAGGVSDTQQAATVPSIGLL